MEWYDGNCKGEYSQVRNERFDLMLDWCQGVATLEFDNGDETVCINRAIEEGATHEESKRDMGTWAYEVYERHTVLLYGAAPDLLAACKTALDAMPGFSRACCPQLAVALEDVLRAAIEATEGMDDEDND
jgi:hypothetical protein